eukprot:9151822-Pyramimonas_sp.AAC.1
MHGRETSRAWARVAKRSGVDSDPANAMECMICLAGRRATAPRSDGSSSATSLEGYAKTPASMATG